MQTMTLKKIRNQLNGIFKVDLSDRKDYLAAQVHTYKAHKSLLCLPAPSSVWHPPMKPSLATDARGR